MSVFASASEALAIGLVLGVAFMIFLFMGYQLLMGEVERKIRDEVRDKMDKHKDIYHKD